MGAKGTNLSCQSVIANPAHANGQTPPWQRRARSPETDLGGRRRTRRLARLYAPGISGSPSRTCSCQLFACLRRNRNGPSGLGGGARAKLLIDVWYIHTARAPSFYKQVSWKRCVVTILIFCCTPSQYTYPLLDTICIYLYIAVYHGLYCQ